MGRAAAAPKPSYDPRAMIGVMKVLDEASGGGGPPEMLSTHPKPANRIAYIQQVIAQASFQAVLPEVACGRNVVMQARLTILSGGQTGVDRAALDFAIDTRLLPP